MSKRDAGGMQGLHLGMIIPRKAGRAAEQEPIRDEVDGHLITFAPTGAGKGVSCIIPALLTWDGPAIVVDPKGENYAVTGKQRIMMGQRVALLDPFRVTGSRLLDSLNPLDLIERKETAADDAAVIARLITRGGLFPKDPFWDERAEALIIGMILHVLGDRHSPPLRNLAEVRHLIEASSTQIRVLAMEMRHANSQEATVAANILSLESSRTRASIVTTASSHMSFLRSGRVQKSTATSTIKLNDIIAGAPLTIYLVMPPDKLLSHGKLLRLWLGVIMTALSRRRGRPHKPTLLLVDEAAQLGPLDELRTAVTLMRGYGVKCWSFWQDLSQLRRIYPEDWQSLVNNCAVQQYFGFSSPQASNEVESYLAGHLPRSLSQLAETDSLLVRRGQRPQIVRRPDYLKDALFQGLFAPNPFYYPAEDDVFDRQALPLAKKLPKNVLPFKRTPDRDSNPEV